MLWCHQSVEQARTVSAQEWSSSLAAKGKSLTFLPSPLQLLGNLRPCMLSASWEFSKCKLSNSCKDTNRIIFLACSMLSQSVARCFHLLHPARHVDVSRVVMQCRPTELSMVMATFRICAIYISGQPLATCGYWALAMCLVQLKKEFLFQLI